MARKTSSPTKASPRKKTSTVTKKTPSNIKPQRPLFPVGTWITVVLLATLIGFAFYLNHKKAADALAVTPTGGSTSVFNSANGLVSGIEIKPAEGESVRIVRDEKKNWTMELPIKTEANQGMAEAASTQITALKSISAINGDPSIFGFDHVAYTITVEFAGGKKQTLEIGAKTPTETGYYVRMDNDKMMIADLSGIEALLQLVQSPPYLNTPIPTALPPTATEVPATQAVTVTPTP